MLASRMIVVGGGWRKKRERYVRHESDRIFAIAVSTN